MANKKIIAFAIIGIMFASCRNDVKWEYKTIIVNDYQDFMNRENTNLPEISMSDAELNKLGAEGWELVNIYELVGTNFPNFGEKQYHTGVKENVKTTSVRFVFKRKSDKKDNQTSDKNNDNNGSVTVSDEPADTLAF